MTASGISAPAHPARWQRIIRAELIREWAGRLGILALSILLCLGAVWRLAVVLDAGGARDALAIAQLTAILCQTVFYVLVAGYTLRRRPALLRSRGWRPRAIAALGAYSIFAFGFLPPRSDLAIEWQIAATLLLLASAALGAVILSRLGRAFSVLPEARGLVTRGPYRFVRHPLYLVEELAAVSGFIEAMSLWAALLLAFQLACQLRRIVNEERVLTAAFPDYGRYQRAVAARLLPGLW
jgi:protein-S-isoprenylcysteine O-methyltransferase Ste14